MSEEPQVVSISSNPTLSPDEIMRKSFPAARRGVDGEAVRAFLAKVAAELREAIEREAALRIRVIEAERRAEEPELDEATLTRAIGTETAKILWTAHDAARNVVSQAEERAAELIAEASHVLSDQIAASEAEALEIRTAAEREAAEYSSRAHAEADSLTDGAHADAVELLDATKEECRQMVAEARELRNRTLADLASRRRSLHIQLQELRTGKDSLLKVVDVVAASVEELRERLASAEDEARIAAAQAGDRVAQEPDQDLIELEAELAAATGVDDGGTATEQAAADGTPAAGTAEAGPESVGEGPAGSGGEGEASSEEGPALAGSSASRRSVDELFARIRASRAAEEAAGAAALAVLQESVVSEPPSGAQSETSSGATGEGIYDFEAASATEVVPTLAGEAANGELDEHHGEPLAAEPAPAAELSGALDQTQPFPVATAGELGGARDMGAGDMGAGDTAAGDTAALEAAVAVMDTAEPAAVQEHRPAEGATEDSDETADQAASDADAVTEPDVEALARRDHLLGPVTAKLGRALKRALQDDQNNLLNSLRQASGTLSLDVLAPPDVQRERFVDAATDSLAVAFSAGAGFLVAGDTVEGPSVTAPAPSELAAFEAAAVMAAELAEDLSSLLRPRIEMALAELDGSSEGSADAAGVAYREWKGTRVEGLAGDFTTRAFAVGELAVLSSLGEAEKPLVRWVVEDDDGGGSCPDCDDNSLAGPQSPGADFPTGHVHPPVHPGCRCLLMLVRS